MASVANCGDVLRFQLGPINSFSFSSHAGKIAEAMIN
jgi:hypothetical protein